jgi:hypothetical protein
VDQCGDITLDVSDTKNTGGWINVTWELLAWSSERNQEGGGGLVF